MILGEKSAVLNIKKYYEYQKFKQYFICERT